MDLSEYIGISGLEVKDENFVNANIAKTQGMLETSLGFPLTDLVNLYSERGKTQSGAWPCDISFGELLPPDNEPDALYRLFTYREEIGWLRRGGAIFIDPCSGIAKVKLVHGDVTVYTFAEDEISLRMGRGFGRLLDLNSVFPLGGPWDCDHPIQVAVDAVWIGTDDYDIPMDIKVVWADLVTWLSDKTRHVKSENRGTRSYTKAEIKSPLEDATNEAILRKYAGPHGTAGRLPV